MSGPIGRLRVVYDCNIFVQAAAFDVGPAGACFRLMEKGSVELFISR